MAMFISDRATFKLDFPLCHKLPEPWQKPQVRKFDGHWICTASGFLHHGAEVRINGCHEDLRWAWELMVDHLVRHEILPQKPERDY